MPNVTSIIGYEPGTQKRWSDTSFSDLTITRSLESACSSFQLTAPFPELANKGRRGPLFRPGARAEIKHGSHLVFTGWIDQVSVHQDGESHTVTLTGRSVTSELVDCTSLYDFQPEGSGAGGEWRNRPAVVITRALADYYGVDVVSQVDMGGTLDRFVVESGETAFEAVERLAALEGYLLTDDPMGQLVLTRAGTDYMDSELTRAGYISIDITADASQLYTEYRCRGQRHGWGSQACCGFGKALDTTLTDRYRVLQIDAEGEADSTRCSTRATWEAATRSGRSTSIVVVVPGWVTSSGSLWESNRLVYLLDEPHDLDGDFLIVSTEFRYDDSGGHVTTLTLAPRAGFELLAPALRPAGKGPGKGQPTQGVGLWESPVDWEMYEGLDI